MTYIVENLSLKSLEKIFLVLDDIKGAVEIQNSTRLNMGYVEGLDGVLAKEHKDIMLKLIKDEIVLNDSPNFFYTTGSCLIMVDQGFYDFIQAVEKQILVLKGNTLVKRKDGDSKLSFDSKESLLFVEGFKIPISMRDKKTIAHDILEYIFIDNSENIDDDFYYSEIASEKFGDTGYKGTPTAWRRYQAACMDIQDKVRKQTANTIEDFLIYNASQRGRVRINQKYLH